MASMATSLATTTSEVAELLTIASTLVSQNIWGRHQRAALKELLLSNDPRTVQVGKMATKSLGDPSYVEPIFEALDDLVFEEVASVLTQMGYRLTAGTDVTANGSTSQVSRSFEELNLARHMTKEGLLSEEETTVATMEQLRTTWFGAVVAGLSQARPLPNGGKCCCIGAGAGLLAFVAVFFADFGTVVGVEHDHELYARAVNTHRRFEQEFRARSLDSSAPRPVELVFYHSGCASPDTLHELRQADVVVVDGSRVDSPHALAAASADSCRPGTIVISLDISFPESDFEMLHSEEFSTVDWGTPSVTVRVQRRKGLNRNAEDPSSFASSSTTSTSSTSTSSANPAASFTATPSFNSIGNPNQSPYMPTSPQRRPTSPPLAIPGKSPGRSMASGSTVMTTPQRLSRNEASSHISSPVGSSLLAAKQRQADHAKRLSPGWRIGNNNASAFVPKNNLRQNNLNTNTLERPTNVITRLSGSYDGTSTAFGSSSLEASSPIGASLMMRKMRGTMESGKGSTMSGLSSALSGSGGSGGSGGSSGGPLGMPSFSPKTGSPLNGSLFMGGTSQPSSPMGAALLRRKQSGQTTGRDGPIAIGSVRATTSGGSSFGSSSPLRRMIQHPLVPGVVGGGGGGGALTEEEEAPSSPMSGALLRKKMARSRTQTGGKLEVERSSPLRLSSNGLGKGRGKGPRTKSGGTSPTFRKLSSGFFDDDEDA